MKPYQETALGRSPISFEHFSTGELKEMLRLSAESASGDRDMTGRILEELLRREQSEPTVSPPDAEQAWKSFQENYLPNARDITLVYDEEAAESRRGADAFPQTEKGRKRPLRFRSVLARAACFLAAMTGVLLVGTTVSYAAGFELWKNVALWTDEIFRIGEGGTDDSAAAHSVAPQLLELQELMTGDGIGNPPLPGYLPEGWEAEETVRHEGMRVINYHCIIRTAEGTEPMFAYTYDPEGSSNAIYTKDEGNPEPYFSGGITFYIMTNAGEYKCIWVDGKCECLFSGMRNRDELIKIIKSIYEGE